MDKTIVPNVTVKAEATDTFGGEANYCWVKRVEFLVPCTASNYAIVREVKKRLGYNGVRCRRENYGDSITLRPYGMCVVIFINLF